MAHELYRTIIESRNVPHDVRVSLRDAATIVIADETHRAKGGHTDFRRCLDRVSTVFRIGLTGTPLTNDVADVYRLVS
jgi:type I site-specific restriction-modification system R (restriction) subunit